MSDLRRIREDLNIKSTQHKKLNYNTFLFSNEEKHYAITRLNFEDNLYFSFLKEVLDFNPVSKLNVINYNHKILEKYNSGIKIAKPVKNLENMTAYKLGKSINPIKFLDTEKEIKSVARFIGNIHKNTIDREKINTNIFAKDVKKVIIRYYKENDEVKNFYLKNIENIKNLLTFGYGFISPANLVNRFFINSDNNVSLLDQSTYLLAPIEIELFAIRRFIKRKELFDDVYEETTSFGLNLNKINPIYKFFNFLYSDTDLKFDAFMNE
jgi:hypothetical protein